MSSRRSYDPSIEEQASMFPRFDVSDVNATRATVDALREAATAQGFERPNDAGVEEIERTIPGPHGALDIPIRVYRPKDRKNAGPGFINFHGGGFILGDLESGHKRCLDMSVNDGAVSVGVDYRLAPECPFPAGVEDCYSALMWVAENAADLQIDPTMIAIGGDSAGGTIAAAVALMARDRGGPELALQMLFYPALDDRCDTISMKQGEDLYIWNSRNSRDMWIHYIGIDRSNVSPYAAPARAVDLSNLPPAYVMTCEHDPLRDEAVIYAMRLMASGVQVELHNFPGTVHGFDYLTPSDFSTQAIDESVVSFRRTMALKSLP